MIFHYTIPERELKGKGYTFQKLYASNHKTYRKEFGTHKEYIIWLWVMEKRIQINDWYGRTKDIIDLFNKAIADGFENKVKVDLFGNKVLYILQDMSDKTRPVMLKSSFPMDSIQTLEGYGAFHRKYREIYLDIPIFKEVVEEINTLTIKK